MRRFALLAVLALPLVAVSPAAAARPASHREGAAIRPVVRVFIDKRTSPAPINARITSITISTVDPSYALVKLHSNRSGDSQILVHLVGHQWHVLGFAIGAFSCSLAPPAVFNDLLGSPSACIPDGY